MKKTLSAHELARFYIEAGVDECIADAPRNCFASTDTPAAPRMAAPLSAESYLQSACAMAGEAKSLEDLRLVLDKFNDCALKKTATNLVFGDGDPNARIVLIGEAPGAEEDRRGLPFVGPSGKLLDHMLASIDLDRTSVFISNTVYWRPPGNRSPTTAEIAICMPFVERMIELVDPDILVAMGGPAAKSLLARNEGIGKLRGRWFTFSTPRLVRPIQTTAIFHPAYLLRTPLQKRIAWRDMLEIRKKLAE